MTIGKGLFACAIAGLVAGCASVASPTVPVAAAPGPALHNPGFEADSPPGQRCPPRWVCAVHSNPGAYRFVVDETAPFEGRRSLRMEPSGSEPWAVASQGIPVGPWEGATLRISFALRLANADGKGAGPYFLAQNGVGGRVGHKQQLFRGTSDWQRVSMEFDVPPGTVLLELGAVLEGTGQAWIDDFKVEVVRLASGGKKPV